ncbi:hypothetical protein EDB19DRAFT_1769492, partial [Suillus lakei]
MFNHMCRYISFISSFLLTTYTSMHRCLRVTEILEIIIRFVLNEDFIDPIFDPSIIQYSAPAFLPYPFGQRCVLHLALTCRAFCEPALEILWSHLRSPWPLVRSLSDELVLSRRTSPAHYTPEQFRPLVLRAAHVQTLYNEGSAANSPAYPFLHASAPTDGPLFPKLRALTWYDTHLASIPTLTLLLPTLNSLILNISNRSFRKAIIPGLRTAAPHLKALEIVLIDRTQAEDGPLEMESLLLSYPDGLTELSIRFCNISSGLLDAIAGWPRLRWLTFHTSFKNMPTVHLHAPQLFQALTTLHISCDGLSFFASFLRATLRLDSDDTCSFGCPNLKKINIHARQCGPANICTITLAESCHDRFTPPCHTPLSFDFRPFLARPTTLADLKTLDIRPAHSIAITHGDILTLARACPHLQILSLGMYNTPLSLYALAYVVGRCHELHTVTLCID